MGKKQIGTMLLFAAAICILLGIRIATSMGTARITLPENAYEEEWDVIMEIADLSSEEQQESDADKTDAYPSEMKKKLDEQCSVSNVTVAIIDTGLDYEGFGQKERVVDIRKGKLDETARLALANPLEDENGHGTAMAEIIAKNSGERVKLMPIRVTDADGRTTVAKVCQAIVLAVENDADIINISMNTLNSATSRLLEVTISQAVESGIPVVVSAGNKSVDTKDISPANVESATVISAVDENGIFADYSNYGDTVDYSAPGCYGGKSGTSYAAAYYSGVLAETFSKGWSAETIDAYLCDRGETGWDRLYGNGIVTLTSFSEQELLQSLFGEDGWEELSGSSILKMGDFHNLTNAKIDSYISESDLADVGYYLSGLSSDERKELLERDTMLTQKVSFCRGNFSDEDILGEETLALTEKEECLYYEKCLAEYEKESKLLHTSDSLTYLHKTGYFYLSFVDETGSGLSTTYKINARVCLSSNRLTGADLNSGKVDTRYVTVMGNNSSAITVWSSVCTGGSDTMGLLWDNSTGEYASFRTDGDGQGGRIFIPRITVLCPAYTLMYTDSALHTLDGSDCSGRTNFFVYTQENNLTYAANKEYYYLRKYGMATTATRQVITSQLNTSHMNLSDTGREFTSESTHCTMYIRLNNPKTTLTVNPNGEKWGGTENTSTLEIINAQTYELGTTTVTNYRADFYGAGDVNDPVMDTTVTTNKAFSYWNLTYAANGSGLVGMQHSYMSGTTFVAGTSEYDQNNVKLPTKGERVTATAVFSGNMTITFPAAPVRTGYTFAGWYTGAQTGSGTLACSSQDAGTATITLASDQSFHAEWVKNSYTVSFYNGDTCLASESYPYRTDIDLSVSELKESESGYYYVQKISASKSVQVEKYGYLLVGWSLSSGGLAVSNVNVPANNDTRLYAVWSSPTSGMKQVVATLQSGGNRGTSVIATIGIAAVNQTLGLKAYFYQANVPVLVTANGIAVTADGYSYAEDNAGNKTPLSGSTASIAVALPVRYTFLYKFYKYNAVTENWDYLENMDQQETADVFAGASFEYRFRKDLFCGAPTGYRYDHAEYNGATVEVPYTIRVTGVADDADAVRTLNVYFYPVTCNLTFDANGGTFPADGLGELFAVSADGTIAERKVLYGSTIGTFPGAQRGTLYSCTGFYDARSGGTAFAANDTVCGDLVLYAGWEAKSGMVRYDAGSNGGNIGGKASLDTLVLCDSEVAYGNYTATRSKYNFLGWSYSTQSMPDGKKPDVLSPSVNTILLQTDALTLYAQFSRTLNVRFHQWNYVENAYKKNGSAPILYNNESSVEVIAPQIQPYQKWEIYGWSKKRNASEVYDIGAGTAMWVEDDLDYYALYRRQVTVTYDTGIAPDKNEITFDGTDTENAYRSSGGGKDVPAEFVIREGPNQLYYTFLYWKGSNGKTYRPGDSYASADDLTLTAVWEPDCATVIYDAQMNGGTISGKDSLAVEIGYGSEIPADRKTYPAVKAGYEFLGWNTDPDAREGLLVNPDMDEKIMDDGILTLYAIYRRTLCASFYQQGEKKVERVTGYLYNNDDRVTVHTPEIAEYTGWTALGWTSGTTAVSDVELCSDSDFELMDDGNFYARYEKEVTLTYASRVKSIDIPSASGYTYHNTFESTARLDEPARFTAAGMIEQEKRSFLDWENEDGGHYGSGEEVLLYDDMLLLANWDDYPRIRALDRYFTLEQATASYINSAVLLDPEYVMATDTEDEDGSLKITLTGYYAEDFASLTGSADLMVYFQVTDSYGHTDTTAATIHVVDTAAKEDPVTMETRFLSPEYYMSGEKYVAEEDGGLSSTSLWRMDEELASCLSGAMENVREAGTGNVRYYSYYTMEDVRGIKTMLLEEQGFGKYVSASTLADFIETYIKKDAE